MRRPTHVARAHKLLDEYLAAYHTWQYNVKRLKPYDSARIKSRMKMQQLRYRFLDAMDKAKGPDYCGTAKENTGRPNCEETE